MAQLAFVTSPMQGWALRELAATLRFELEQQGVPSTLHMDVFPEPGPDTVYVLIGPPEFVALEGEVALPDDQILRRTIFLSAEDPGAAARADVIALLRRAGAVFDIHAATVARLQQAGIPARHLRLGYSKIRDHFDPATERPIDVLFFGSHSLRRARQLAACAPLLARHNCVLQLSDGSSTHPSDSTSFLGESKWGLLERAKIVLNLHRSEDTQLEWPRVLDAIHTGAVVVTEQASRMSPLIAGEHVLVASPASLPFVLEAALGDAERLARLRRDAYARIRDELPFAAGASAFAAAAVELVGRRVEPDAYLGRRRSGPSDGSVNPEAAQAASTIGPGISQVTLEVSELRREVARLEQIVRARAGAPSPTGLLHESPAWRARRQPEVSVLVGTHNHAQRIRPVLDSLARGWPRDVEVVVVDDGSDDDSCALVRDWVRVHPEIPSLLVRHPFERGLGSARNTALEFARAPYCLILRAEMELYPRCVDVLAWTLDGIADAAFAYPILEVIGATDGDHLLNVFGWDPERLRTPDRITAITMIRTTHLRQLGGFSADPLMAGWEDYDLWRRVADRGWRGQLVPQVLGRYRPGRVVLSRE